MLPTDTARSKSRHVTPRPEFPAHGCRPSEAAAAAPAGPRAAQELTPRPTGPPAPGPGWPPSRGGRRGSRQLLRDLCWIHLREALRQGAQVRGLHLDSRELIGKLSTLLSVACSPRPDDVQCSGQPLVRRPPTLTDWISIQSASAEPALAVVGLSHADHGVVGEAQRDCHLLPQ